MKKLVLGLAILTVSLASNAQSTSLGINGGFGDTWIKNYKDIKFMPGGNVGLSLIHSTKTNFGFGADLKYSWEGAKEEYTTAPTAGNVAIRHTTSLQYVRLPLKAIYFFGKYGQRVRPKIYAGPSLGYMVKANDKFENASNSTITSDVRTTDNYDKFDVGVLAGAGLNFRLVKNTWFTADVNYYNGFRDIREHDVPSGSTRLSNENVNLTVGVMWGL